MDYKSCRVPQFVLFFLPASFQGQFTEKRVYLNSKLPTWVSSWVPAIFYITEKAWNYYPYTITEYSCSFLPRFSVSIETRFEVRGAFSRSWMQLEGAPKKRCDISNLQIYPPYSHFFAQGQRGHDGELLESEPRSALVVDRRPC